MASCPGFPPEHSCTGYLGGTRPSYPHLGLDLDVLLAVPVRPPYRHAELLPADDSARSEAVGKTSVIEKKRAKGKFDVFLCHNSEDKVAVRRIAKQLLEQGILPWLDEWELQPGLPIEDALEKQITKIKSAAVFVGKSGRGPWQNVEIKAFLRQFVKRKCPVIPVILPDSTKTPRLPALLGGMTWVDFREDDPNPLAQLIWGATGERIEEGS